MPRRQKAPALSNSNEALALLSLQQMVRQLAEARVTLDKVLELVHEPPLNKLTSAQDRRTLNTAQFCLDCIRIRLEAHANTMEDTVRQKQMSLILRQTQAEEFTELPTELSVQRKPGLLFETSTRLGLFTVDDSGSGTAPR